MRRDLEKVQEEINNHFEEALQQNVAFDNSKDSIDTLKGQMLGVARLHPLFSEKDFQFDVNDKGDVLDIIPKNLYTLLWLNHIYLPIAVLKDVKEVETPYGVFGFKDGKPCHKLTQPVNTDIEVKYAYEVPE